MTVTDTIIPGVKIIDPVIHLDQRGYFFESYSERDFDRLVVPGIRFVQDNESCSHRGVMRGLHFQLPPHAQAKLVRVVEGSIVDVAVDMRDRTLPIIFLPYMRIRHPRRESDSKHRQSKP